VKATLMWKKFSADVVLSKVQYKPKTSAATANFDASEVDVRLRYYVTGPVSAELGFINRKMDPEFEASPSAPRRLARACLRVGSGRAHVIEWRAAVRIEVFGGRHDVGAWALQLGLASPWTRCTAACS